MNKTIFSCIAVCLYSFALKAQDSTSNAKLDTLLVESKENVIAAG